MHEITIQNMKNEKLFQHVIHNLSLYKILYSTTVKDL